MQPLCTVQYREAAYLNLYTLYFYTRTLYVQFCDPRAGYVEINGWHLPVVLHELATRVIVNNSSGKVVVQSRGL